MAGLPAHPALTGPPDPVSFRYVLPLMLLYGCNVSCSFRKRKKGVCMLLAPDCSVVYFGKSSGS